MKRTNIVIPLLFWVISFGFANDGEWVSHGPHGGNAITMLIDTQSSNIVYGFNRFGGVLKSVDGGISSEPIANGLFSYIYEAEISPTNPNTIYLTSNAGLFASEDAGENWELRNSEKEWINVAVDPMNSSTLYATSYEDYFNKVYKSTNGGYSWVTIYDSLETMDDIVIDPVNTDIIYFMAEMKKIMKSVDGGVSWLQIHQTEEQIYPLYHHPSESGHLFGIVMASNKIIKSRDGGMTWASFEILDNENTLLSLAVEPTTGYLYVGREVGIVKSPDGGSTWEIIDETIRNVSDIIIDPNNNDIIYACSGWGWDGIWKSKDRGENWTQTALCYSYTTTLKQSPQDFRELFTGSIYQGVFVRKNDGENWHCTFPDRTIRSIDVSSNGSRLFLLCIPKWSENDSLRVYRSDNNGLSWQAIYNDLFFRYGFAPLSIVIKPDSANVAYIGASSLDGFSEVYRTSDGGQNWAVIHPNGIWNLGFDPNNSNIMYGSMGDLRISLNSGYNWNSILSESIRSYVIDPKDSNIIYAGLKKKGIFKSVDSGITWETINNGFPERDDLYVRCLAVHPINSEVLFAILIPHGLFMSVNRGQNWQPIYPPLQALPFPDYQEYNFFDNTLVVSYSDGITTLFVGTSNGVWQLSGIKTVVNDDDFSHSHQRQLPDSPVHLYQNYPNPFNSETVIRYDVREQSEIHLEIFDVNGRHIKTLCKGKFINGSYFFSWYGRNQNGQPLPSGMYFCRLISSGYSQITKLILLK